VALLVVRLLVLDRLLYFLTLDEVLDTSDRDEQLDQIVEEDWRLDQWTSHEAEQDHGCNSDLELKVIAKADVGGKSDSWQHAWEEVNE